MLSPSRPRPTTEPPVTDADARAVAAPLAGPTDAALMERAARGDASAFEAIYDRHAPRALALCRRILGSRADADEVLHDVFVEAWCSAAHYDAARGSVLTWLLVRVRSRALDRRARRQRQHAAPLDVHGPLGSTWPATERQIALREALSQLEPPLFSALELTYFEGLTAAEVAERTGIPEGTVKSRLARALSALQHFLQREPSEDEP